MKKVSVLGIHLWDVSVRESIRTMGHYFVNHKINVIYFLTTEALLEASANDEMRNYIESMDMTIPMTTDILSAAKVTNRYRIKEVENRQFSKEMLEKLEREQATILLLSETKEQMEELHLKLSSRKRLRIVKSVVMEELTGGFDQAINEINQESPQVLISQLEMPRQEQFIYENRKRVNIKIWIAFPSGFTEKSEESVKQGKLRTLVARTLFKRIVSKYDKNQGEDGNDSS
ncbi:hypothetical protein D7X25_13465 [bacterium 1XD42-8]|jgi:UDP-N-acetyl-D-mannosaminuronic acid transferase (WecB/TagA/CpsF family)|nr:hypothetical protein [Lachnospiraceae bacterium]RKJ52974.1 hypothetical protein D7X25_13465 [bacterium 1XD42-8]